MKYVFVYFLTFTLFISYNSYAEIDCNSLLSFPSTKEECEKCSNRDFGTDLISYHMLHEERDVCYLKECPDGYFFDSRHKNCLPCDYETDQCLSVSLEECNKCPNRQMNKYKFTTQCELPFSCPKDKPAMHIWSGFEDSCGKDCVSCDEADISFWADDCSVCPGYEIEKTSDHNFGKVFCINREKEAQYEQELQKSLNSNYIEIEEDNNNDEITVDDEVEHFIQALSK